MQYLLLLKQPLMMLSSISVGRDPQPIVRPPLDFRRSVSACVGGKAHQRFGLYHLQSWAVSLCSASQLSTKEHSAIEMLVSGKRFLGQPLPQKLKNPKSVCLHTLVHGLEVELQVLPPFFFSFFRFLLGQNPQPRSAH